MSEMQGYVCHSQRNLHQLSIVLCHLCLDNVGHVAAHWHMLDVSWLLTPLAGFVWYFSQLRVSRFPMILLRPTIEYRYMGFRCVIELDMIPNASCKRN